MKQYPSMMCIDGNKLKDILNERKLSPGKISEDLGFSRYYITNHIYLGSMPEAVVNDLRDFYDIYPNWYVSKTRIPATPLNVSNNAAIDKYKFESILSERKLTKKAIYEKIGISKDTLNTSLRRGYLSKKYCTSLAKEFHIYAEDYEPDPPEAEYIKNDISAVQEACKKLEKEKSMFKTVYNNKEVPTEAPVEEVTKVVEENIKEEVKKPVPKIDISKIVEEASYRGTMRAIRECFGLEE